MKTLDELHIDRNWDSFLSFIQRRLQGVQTGNPSVDRVLLGLGGITILQGAPGCNKSTWALQIAHHNAKLGHPALIIDRENGRERFRMRLMCQANRISENDLKAAAGNRPLLRQYAAKVRTLPIYPCTDPITEPEKIGERIKELWEKYQKPMTLVVDSLQSLPIIDQDERLSIQSWLKHFDQLKLDWEGKLTTLITSEKKRGDNEYDRASLSAGKGAGGIEYKAEMVLDMRRDKETGNIIVEVVKNRDGISNIAMVLSLVMANPANKSSFSFLLEDGGKIDV
jgi:KaiC/GvpD/RAD55 family RecA-like ATPase